LQRKQISEFTLLSISVLGISFIVGVFGRMLMEQFPNLVTVFSDEFGWSRGTIASIFSVAAIVNGISNPVAGLLFDRWGARKVFALGFAVSGSGLILTGYATNIWHLYIGLGVCMGFSASLCGNVTNSSLVSRWFNKNLPLALSIIFSAYGIGSFIGFSISQLLIRNLGWRTAEIYIGIFLLSLILVLLVLPWKKLSAGQEIEPLKQQNESTQTVEDHTFKSAIKTPAFWGLLLIFFFTGNGTYATLFQSVTYIIDRGLSPIEASFNVGLTGLLVTPGMIIFGYLLTRYNIIIISAATHIITTLSILFLYLFSGPETHYLLILFILFFGATAGTRASIVGSLAARIFYGRNFGVIFGSIAIGGGLGVACGSFMSGWIFDLTGSYGASFFYAAICMMAGALPTMLVPSIRAKGKNTQQ
jgi:MFS family permease